MNTTAARTVYGTWANFGDGEIDLETSVAVALGEYAADFDVPALIEAYRDAIDALSPEGVTLVGDEFHGPWPMSEGAGALVVDAVRSVDFWALAARFDRAGVAA